MSLSVSATSQTRPESRDLVLRYDNMHFGPPASESQEGRGPAARAGQIEYADEDPRIREMFEEECAKRGVKCEMDSFV
jgi:hypothetical protein